MKQLKDSNKKKVKPASNPQPYYRWVNMSYGTMSDLFLTIEDAKKDAIEMHSDEIESLDMTVIDSIEIVAVQFTMAIRNPAEVVTWKEME